MNKLGIVRWLPLVVAAAACSTDDIAAPDQVEPSLLVSSFAPGGNMNGNGGGNGRWSNGNANLGHIGISEQRVWQIRYYPNADRTQPGTYRMCQLNPLEDEDGSDWMSASGKIHQIEPDAFLLVKEFQAGFEDVDVAPDGTVAPRDLAMNYGWDGDKHTSEKWKLTFIGRAHWTYNAWMVGSEISRESSAAGVVAPVDGALRAFAETQASATGVGGLSSSSYGVDLFNTPMTSGSPWALRVDSLLAATYSDAPHDLRFAVCDAHFYQFVLKNEVETDQTKIPGGYWDLVPGAR